MHSVISKSDVSVKGKDSEVETDSVLKASASLYNSGQGRTKRVLEVVWKQNSRC